MSDAQPGEVEHWADALACAFDSVNAQLGSFVNVMGELNAIVTKFDLAWGGNRARHRHLKRPGVQFARFADGRLTQYKRLADGTVVKV